MGKLNESLIDEFYKIFTQSNEGMYAGSRGQMKLTVELKLGVFIPSAYFDRVATAFISSKLIIKTDKTMKIERIIGKKKYNPTHQIVYLLNKDLENKEEILNSLKVTFSDFEDKAEKQVTEKDIKKLRNLEEEKGINLSSLLQRKSFPYEFKFTDEAYLYEIPQSKIHEYINLLETYEVQKKQEYNKPKKAIKQKIEGYYNKTFNKYIKLIEDTIALEEAVYLNIINKDIYYKRCDTVIAQFKIKSIIVEENNIILTDKTNYRVIITPNSFSIDKGSNTLSFLEHDIKYNFKISEVLSDEMLVIDYLQNNLGLLYY